MGLIFTTFLLLTTPLACANNVPSPSPCHFVDQPKNVTVLQGHDASIKFSIYGCVGVSGSITFINSGTTDIVDAGEIVLITEGNQEGKKEYRVTLSNVTEPVEVQFEAYPSPFSQSEDILSHKAFIFVQGCPGPVTNASLSFVSNITFYLDFIPPADAQIFPTHYDITVFIGNLSSVVYNTKIETDHTWVTVDSPLLNSSYICRITPVNEVGRSSSFTDLPLTFPGFLGVQQVDIGDVEMNGEAQACVIIYGTVCAGECLNCRPTFLSITREFGGESFTDCVETFDESVSKQNNECIVLEYRYCMKMSCHYNVSLVYGNLVGSDSFGPFVISSHNVQNVVIGCSEKQSNLVCFTCYFASNTTVSGCQFNFTPALNEKKEKIVAYRKDKEAMESFKIPEGIVDLTVEVYDFPRKENIEPAWRSSSISVPATDVKTDAGDKYNPMNDDTTDSTTSQDDASNEGVIISSTSVLFVILVLTSVIIVYMYWYRCLRKAKRVELEQSPQEPSSTDRPTLPTTTIARVPGHELVTSRSYSQMDEVVVLSTVTSSDAYDTPVEQHTSSEVIPHSDIAETDDYLAQPSSATESGKSVLAMPMSTKCDENV